MSLLQQSVTQAFLVTIGIFTLVGILCALLNIDEV